MKEESSELFSFDLIEALSYVVSLGTTIMVFYTMAGGDVPSIFRKIRSVMESPHYGCQSRREEEVEAAYRRGYKKGRSESVKVDVDA